MGDRKRRNVVGDRVRRLRSDAGISQTDLAARCERLGFGARRITISHIETGHRTVSDLEMILLARALNVSVDELAPDELPAWKKDLRPPSAKEDEGE